MTKLSGNQLKQRSEDFEIWKSTLDARLDKITTIIKKSFDKPLDFYPYTLWTIEAFIKNKYSRAQGLMLASEQEIADGLASYIGEVFIRNSNGSLSWSVSDDEDLLPGKLLNFHPRITGEILSSAIDPYHDLMLKVLIDISDAADDNQFLYNRFSELKIPEKISKPRSNETTDERSYAHFIFLTESKTSQNPLAEMQQMIDSNATVNNWDNYSSVINAAGDLIITFSKYQFTLSYNDADHVVEESREIAGDYDGCVEKAKFENASQRIEFSGDGDFDGDYINESMLILEAIMDRYPLIYSLNEAYFYGEE